MNTFDPVSRLALPTDFEDLSANALDPAHLDYLPLAPLPGSSQEQAELDELLELNARRFGEHLRSCIWPDRQRYGVSSFLPHIPNGEALVVFFEQRWTASLYRSIFSSQLVRGLLPGDQVRLMQTYFDQVVRAAMRLLQYYEDRMQHLHLTIARRRPIELDPTLAPRMEASICGPVARCSVLAGAASEFAAHLFPHQRDDWDALADNVGMARLWGSVHFRSEHIYGLRLGRALAHRISQRGLQGMPVPIVMAAPKPIPIPLSLPMLIPSQHSFSSIASGFGFS